MFHVKFHTKLALRKLLAGQSEVEKKVITKLQSRLQPFYGHVLQKHESYLKPSNVFSVGDSFTCLSI